MRDNLHKRKFFTVSFEENKVRRPEYPDFRLFCGEKSTSEFVVNKSEKSTQTDIHFKSDRDQYLDSGKRSSYNSKKSSSKGLSVLKEKKPLEKGKSWQDEKSSFQTEKFRNSDRESVKGSKRLSKRISIEDSSTKTKSVPLDRKKLQSDRKKSQNNSQRSYDRSSPKEGQTSVNRKQSWKKSPPNGQKQPNRNKSPNESKRPLSSKRKSPSDNESLTNVKRKSLSDDKTSPINGRNSSSKSKRPSNDNNNALNNSKRSPSDKRSSNITSASDVDKLTNDGKNLKTDGRKSPTDKRHVECKKSVVLPAKESNEKTTRKLPDYEICYFDADGRLRKEKNGNRSNFPRSPEEEHLLSMTPAERDAHRLKQREKQVEYGKRTEGYNNYIQMIPIAERTAEHPWTPNKHEERSTRSWQGIVKLWRRKLHYWDAKSDNCEETEEPQGTTTTSLCFICQRLHLQ